MKIAILGFGREGQSVLKFLQNRGLTRKITPTNADPSPFGRKVRDEIWVLDKNPEVKVPSGVKKRLGKNYLKNLNRFDLVFRSPGVPYNLPELKRARKAGVKFSSATKLFFEISPTKNIIGVTGTKGKGTTTTLIHRSLAVAGKRSFLGGNIGEPPLNFVGKLNSRDWVVLELSSFQLMDMEWSPHIAVVLMVTSEHLDWHANLREYVTSKERIIAFQSPKDYAILNRDYPQSAAYARKTRARIFTFSRRRRVRHGVWVEKDTFWFSGGRGREKIMRVADLKLPGRHNWENVAAAITVSKILKIKNDAIKKAVRNFRGLEHRLEFVAKKGGVRYYNDSYSTTPETAIVAIQAFDEPKILILGGSSKGSNFAELGKVISGSKNIRTIIGVGAEWPRIKEKISAKGGSPPKADGPRVHASGGKFQNLKIIEGCKDMKEIINAAKVVAKPGDVVLLSPACASFDMFKNYTDRGKQFKKLVKKLK